LNDKKFDINKAKNEYLDKLYSDRKTENTIKNYKVTYNQLVDLIAENMNEIEVTTLEFEKQIKLFLKHLSDRYKSSSTIQAKRTHIKGLICFCYKENLIDKDFSGNIESVKKEKGKEAAVLTPEEIDRINKLLIKDLEEAREYDVFYKARNRFIVMLFLWTGARKSEVTRLRWKDIDMTSNKIIFRKSKGNKTRSMPLIQELKLQIYEYKEILEKLVSNGYDVSPGYYIFRSYHKKVVDGKEVHMTPRNVSDILDDIFKRAEVSEDITPHSIRHTFASYSIENGVTIVALSKILGHGSVKITLDTYAHIINEKQMRNEMNKLNYNKSSYQG